MTESKEAEQPKTQEPDPKPENGGAQGPPELPAVKQGGTSLAKEKSNHLWNLATKYAKSAIVPDIFQDKPDDCFIALQMANRMNVDPLMLMQSAYIVHGKLGFEAKFTTGLVNNSDLIVGRLKYEERPEHGTDPFDPEYAVRAFATDKEIGQEVYGEWITWALVKAEGWHLDKKSQKSKWMTMPGQMFHYRAATFFVRRHYPEVLMGMKTTDEIIDADYTVTNTDRTQALKDRIEGAAPATAVVTDTDPSPAPEADPPAEPEGGQDEPDAEDFEKYVKEKQGKLWSLCEKISGGKVVDTDAVLHELAGTVKLDTITGEDLDKAIADAEARLKEKPKGKGNKTGELFDQ